MKERPIIFSAPMVRALLNGSKTQTRRVVKPEMALELTDHGGFTYLDKKGNRWMCGIGSTSAETMRNFTRKHCHYGQPGDRLWVRETWMDLRGIDGAVGDCMYRATFGNAPPGCKWKPSIFMPRWASRITLEITGVRVERLQDISEEDCTADGINTSPESGLCFATGRPLNGYSFGEFFSNMPGAHKEAYRRLWESINGPKSWDENPWVWVLEFKRVTA